MQGPARAIALSLLLAHAQANAQTTDPRWLPVTQLAPGTTLLVVEKATAYRTRCLLDSADASSLSCTPASTVPKRIVFSKPAIAALFKEEVQQTYAASEGKHELIGGAIGAGFGGGACRDAEPGVIAGCAVLGALAGFGLVIALHANQPPPAPGLRVHNHLLYRAAKP